MKEKIGIIKLHGSEEYNLAFGFELSCVYDEIDLMHYKELKQTTRQLTAKISRDTIQCLNLKKDLIKELNELDTYNKECVEIDINPNRDVVTSSINKIRNILK